MNISEKQLRKLNTAAKMVEKGDFAVIEKILEYEDFLEDFLDKTKDLVSLTEKLEEVKQYCVSNIGTLDNNVKDVYNTLVDKIDALTNKIKDTISKTDLDKLSASFDKKIENIPNVSDIKKTIANKIKELEQKISEIKINVTPIEVRDKLETLKDDERLDKSAIKGLDEELKSLRSIKGTTTGGMFGVKQIRMVSFEFAGDDSTTVFYLPKEPGAKGLAIWAYYQGQHLQLGTHFTVANKVFTCVGFTPQTGSYIEGFIMI